MIFLKPFESLAIAKKVIANGLEVNFTRPSKPVSWEDTIIKCLLTTKVLKTLIARFVKERKDYHFLYKYSFLYRKTKFNILYNSNSYTFEVKTGLKLKDDKGYNRSEIKNEIIQTEFIYKNAESVLDSLVIQMREDLPVARYEEIMKKYNDLRASSIYPPARSNADS
jgi:hypothetical protein